MSPMRWTTTALTLLALSAAAHAQASADPYAGLRTYDFTNREPVFAVRQAIHESVARNDKGHLAEIETGLIGILQDPAATFGGKQEACRMLYLIGTDKSVPALAALLNDEKLGDAARYALERNPSRAASAALRNSLREGAPSLLPAVGPLLSIGNRRDDDAVPMLQRLLFFDGGIPPYAHDALGQIGTPAAVKALYTLKFDDTRALANAADQMVRDGHKRDAEAVYADLAAHGSLETQGDALHGLLVVESKSANAVALTDLKSPDGTLQVTAAGLVAALGTDALLAETYAAYPSLSPPVQTALIAGFGARGYAAAKPLVESALASSDPTLRMAAIRAAGPIEGAAAVRALTHLAASGTGRDKREARLALAQIPGSAADNAILQLSRTGTDPAQRSVLIEVLSDRQSPAYRASLLDAARGSDEKVAVAAIKSFAQNGTATDEPALVSILTATQSDTVRDTASDAIATIGTRATDRDAAARPLIDALPSATPAAREALIPALGQIGGARAIAAVAQATTAPDADLRSAAVTALADTATDPAALVPLWNLARTAPDKSTRVQALRGYLRLLALDDHLPTDERFAALKAALTLAERPEEKKAALSGLRDCRIPAALDLAAAHLDDPAIFDEAADAVLTLAAPAQQGNHDLPAVKTPGTTAALDKIITLSKDDAVKAKAQALLGKGR